MEVHTIGFTKKTASEFFGALRKIFFPRKPDAWKHARPVWRAGGGNGARETWPPRPLPTLHLSYDNRNADLLFQVVSRRYERKTVVITTNLAFAEWPTIFPNAACTTALIDRLVHHSEIISVEGESYRKREAQLAKEETTSRRRKKRS